MEEIWKPVNGYENRYEVSNAGQIRSVFRKFYLHNKTISVDRNRILKQAEDTGGYLRVKLYNENTVKTHKVHRIVAESFISNPQNKPTVNHIDHNKKNNSVNNLEWSTVLENNRHSDYHTYRKMSRGENHRGSKLTEMLVSEIRNKYVPVIYGLGKLAAEYNVSKKTILNIVKRRIWTHI